jgi:hypothetical protein
LIEVIVKKNSRNCWENVNAHLAFYSLPPILGEKYITLALILVSRSVYGVEWKKDV